MSLIELELESIQNTLDQFDTYESYLDSYVTQQDIDNLENLDLARKLVELGLNIKTQLLTKEEFEKKKALLEHFRRK